MKPGDLVRVKASDKTVTNIQCVCETCAYRENHIGVDCLGTVLAGDPRMVGNMFANPFVVVLFVAADNSSPFTRRRCPEGIHTMLRKDLELL